MKLVRALSSTLALQLHVLLRMCFYWFNFLSTAHDSSFNFFYMGISAVAEVIYLWLINNLWSTKFKGLPAKCKQYNTNVNRHTTPIYKKKMNTAPSLLQQIFSSRASSIAHTEYFQMLLVALSLRALNVVQYELDLSTTQQNHILPFTRYICLGCSMSSCPPHTRFAFVFYWSTYTSASSRFTFNRRNTSHYFCRIETTDIKHS